MTTPSSTEYSFSRTATGRKVLSGFAAALALIALISTVSYRAARGFVDESRAIVTMHETLESLEKTAARDGWTPARSGEISDLHRQLAERSSRAAARAERLETVVIAGNVVRALVVILALLALVKGLAARGRAEDDLRRSRDQALDEAEGRRVAQAEAERLGERLGAVLDHVDIGVMMFELDGGISVFNRAAERIHGTWREQLERLIRAGTHPPMLEDGKTAVVSGEDPLARALKGQNVRDVRLFYRTPFRTDGYFLNVSAVPLHDHRGLPAGAVLMFTEMPERRGS